MKIGRTLNTIALLSSIITSVLCAAAAPPGNLPPAAVTPLTSAEIVANIPFVFDELIKDAKVGMVIVANEVNSGELAFAQKYQVYKLAKGSDPDEKIFKEYKILAEKVAKNMASDDAAVNGKKEALAIFDDVKKHLDELEAIKKNGTLDATVFTNILKKFDDFSKIYLFEPFFATETDALKVVESAIGTLTDPDYANIKAKTFELVDQLIELCKKFMALKDKKEIFTVTEQVPAPASGSSATGTTTSAKTEEKGFSWEGFFIYGGCVLAGIIVGALGFYLIKQLSKKN